MLRPDQLCRVLQQVTPDAPDFNWTARLRRSLSRASEDVSRVAQVDVGANTVNLTDHETIKDKFYVGLECMALQQAHLGLHRHSVYACSTGDVVNQSARASCKASKAT